MGQWLREHTAHAMDPGLDPIRPLPSISLSPWDPMSSSV